MAVHADEREILSLVVDLLGDAPLLRSGRQRPVGVKSQGCHERLRPVAERLTGPSVHADSGLESSCGKLIVEPPLLVRPQPSPSRKALPSGQYAGLRTVSM